MIHAICFLYSWIWMQFSTGFTGVINSRAMFRENVTSPYKWLYEVKPIENAVYRVIVRSSKKCGFNAVIKVWPSLCAHHSTYDIESCEHLVTSTKNNVLFFDRSEQAQCLSCFIVYGYMLYFRPQNTNLGNMSNSYDSRLAALFQTNEIFINARIYPITWRTIYDSYAN